MLGRMMQEVVEVRMDKEEEKVNNNGSSCEEEDDEYYYDCDEDEGGGGGSGGKSKRKNDSYGRVWKGKDKSYKYNNINMNMYVMVATLYLAAAAAEATVFPRRSLLNNVSPPASANWSSAPLYTSDTLEYYVHALSNSTAYTSSSPPSPNWSSTFGLGAAFDYNVTASSSADSAQRGFIRGFEVVDSLSAASPMSILVLNSIDYNDGYFVGSLSLHGAANVNDTDYDIAIAGGTGSFRGAAGVASITNLLTPGSDHVFRHILHFTHLAHY